MPRMPAPTHDRYPYAPITARPVYDWPGADIVGQADARVWFTTSGEIAKHAAALPAGVVPSGVDSSTRSQCLFSGEEQLSQREHGRFRFWPCAVHLNH